MFRFLRNARSSNRDSRLLLQAQLPFDGAVAGITVFLVFTQPVLLGQPGMLLALTLAVVATLAALFVPWSRVHPYWLIGVAAFDMATVAILRDATTGVLLGTGILIVFPVIWLAYSFSWRVLALAIAGSILLVAFPFLRAGTMPTNAVDWGNLIVVPITVSFIGIAVNTAARQFRAQRRSLRDTRMTTQAVVDSVDAGVLVLDPNDKVVLVNQPARDIMTKSGMTVGGAPDADLLVYEEDGATPAGIRAGTFGDATRDEDIDRVLLVGETGSKQSALSTTSHRIERESGELVGTVVVAHDVSNYVQAAHDRDLFLQTMSHELRTPLTSILGYLEIIADTIDVDNVGIASELDVIKRNSDRLHALVSALLSVSSGPQPFAPTEVVLDDIARDSLAALEDNAGRAKVELHGPGDDHVTVLCDPTRMRQVIDNLVSNGIKYTPPGGSVRVTVRTDAHEAVVEVRDSGMGIRADERAQVFTPFFRGRDAREQAVQGVGLGLTIVKETVDAHGGRVDVQSGTGTGTGTTVTVRLPFEPVS